MRYQEILNERVVNLHTPDEKMRYAKPVWDMLSHSYQKMGGFKSANSPEELANEPGYWKLVRRGDRITALAIYKQVPKTRNFKLIASAAETELDPTTGQYRTTTQGLRDYGMVKSSDIAMKRSWAEVSGPAERIMIKSGAKPISNRYAEFLTGKNILALDPDGFHYTRLIQGEPKQKMIIGFIDLSPQGRADLAASGLDIQDLPPNIQTT